MQPGEKIKEFRKNKGLTQKELAESLGYSQDFLSAIEIGKVEPSREFLKKLNEIFGISSDYILYGSDDERKNLIKEMDVKYEILPTSTKKLLDNVKEILESGNDVMIDALKANIKALLKAVRMTKNQNENKGGD